MGASQDDKGKTGPKGERSAHDGPSFETLQSRCSFQLGRLVVTRHASDTLLSEDILAGLSRHARGDWGEVDEGDCRANEFALGAGERILSTYRTARGEEFWVITEADRSVTTVLLPEDY